MHQVFRFATLNVLNLALPGKRFYDNIEPHTAGQYDAKTTWLAQQLDRLDADVIALQEIFSQAAVGDVLAKTRLYRDARHVGLEPAPRDGKLTPAVALVSRLPVGRVEHIVELPRNLTVPLPEIGEAMTHFTRPILRAEITLAPDFTVQLFVVHLKSKRPDYRGGEADSGPGNVQGRAEGQGQGQDQNQYQNQLGAAVLRSLIRRATEALGLRYLISDAMGGRRRAVMVMGDFNDVASAVSTQLVLGAGMGLGPAAIADADAGKESKSDSDRSPVGDSGKEAGRDVGRDVGRNADRVAGRSGQAGRLDERLFDSYRIQSRRDPLRDVGFTHVHDGCYETIDHVLVSEEFNPASPLARGEVIDVTYVNDHVTLAQPEASDHGAVLVRIGLRR